MDTVTIQLLSREPHLSQILTGFTLLSKGKNRILDMNVEDLSADSQEPFRGPLLRVKYRDKVIIYDMMDGYQLPDVIRYHLAHCDYYFKRSFSEKKNRELELPNAHRMFPLGLNYHVSCRQHPMDQVFWKEWIKKALGLPWNDFCHNGFVPRLFEQKPRYRASEFTVLFCARLWGEDASLSAELNAERREINEKRIAIMRRLRSMQGVRFLGGLSDNAYTREAAPDLILPAELVNRRTYLKRLRQSDICIGSMGLHESIGWKTGEYVAAAKAIVNETLHYEVPGDFREGQNYLRFETAEQCIAAVERLVADPQLAYEMKCANRRYYLENLRPDVLVWNSLQTVDRMESN